MVELVKVSSPYTARDGMSPNSVPYPNICIVDIALKTNNPYLYHVMSPIKCLAVKKLFQSLPLQGSLASKN